MENANNPGHKNAISAKKRALERNIIIDAIDEALGGDEGASKEHRLRAQTFAQLEYFGLGMLNIQEAAELIACDMWAEGKIEVEALDDFDGHSLAPEVKAALAEETSAFVTRLTQAIELERLQPARTARDFDEKIILSETFIAIKELEEWLNERGYHLGEAFKEWHSEERDIGDRIIDELIWIRSVKENSRDRIPAISFTSSHDQLDLSNQAELIAAYKSAILEVQHLRKRLASAESRSMEKPESPASPKHRRTLLTLIGALCEAVKIDVGKRGAAQRIMEMTEQLGVPVDDETIRKVLAAIPDALEGRSK
ncbi:hypothetical protein D3C78_293860 [compost metagenome]